MLNDYMLVMWNETVKSLVTVEYVIGKTAVKELYWLVICLTQMNVLNRPYNTQMFKMFVLNWNCSSSYWGRIYPVCSCLQKAPVWEITGAEFSKSEMHTADGISIRFPRCTRMRDDKDWKTATNLQQLKVPLIIKCYLYVFKHFAWRCN